MTLATRRRTAIDFEEARRKLEAGRLSLEKLLSPDADRMQKAFQQRADRLARRRSREANSLTIVPVLTFFLGKERYGIELKEVAAVLPFSQVTGVPGGPPEIAGVIPWRGRILSVLSLARRLSVEEDAESSNYIVLARSGEVEAGLKTGPLGEVETIADSEWSFPANFREHSLVKAFISQRLRLLDVAALLSGTAPNRTSRRKEETKEELL